MSRRIKRQGETRRCRHCAEAFPSGHHLVWLEAALTWSARRPFDPAGQLLATCSTRCAGAFVARWQFAGTFGRVRTSVPIVEILQALSSELVVDRLAEQLPVLAIQHGGADRALLFLGTADGYRIEAEATQAAGDVKVSLWAALEAPADWPVSIIDHVLRTREIVPVDAFDSNPFASDEYFNRKRPRAIYCLPLVKGERLIGVLY